MSTRDDSDEPRRPRRVYGVGDEPDGRFTLANERTFLAWIRTSLALMAGGVAIDAIAARGEEGPLRTALAVLLLVSGVVCSAVAFRRWMITERALRTESPLPAPKLAPALSYGLAVVGLGACALVLIGGA